METVDITVERRAEFRKGPARRLRAAGRVPGIIYGPKRQALAVSVSALEFERKLTHLEGTHLVRLVSATGSDPDLHDRVVLVRELQEHPVSGLLLHADFYEVDLTARIEVSVPLHFVGKAAGVLQGAGQRQARRFGNRLDQRAPHAPAGAGHHKPHVGH